MYIVVNKYMNDCTQYEIHSLPDFQRYSLVNKFYEKEEKDIKIHLSLITVWKVSDILID